MKPEITTNTIAELYEKQGHLDRAMKVYSDILEQDPGDEEARKKLMDIKARMEMSEEDDIGAQIARLEGWLNGIRAMRGEEVEEVAAVQVEEMPPGYDIDIQIVRLEGWLNDIRAIRGVN